MQLLQQPIATFSTIGSIVAIIHTSTMVGLRDEVKWDLRPCLCRRQ